MTFTVYYFELEAERRWVVGRYEDWPQKVGLKQRLLVVLRLAVPRGPWLDLWR